jgi:LysM repeat protein
MLKTRHFPRIVLTLLCAALVFAACTRPAITSVAATTPAEGTGGGGEGVDIGATETAVANMQQILFTGQTQTAQAVIDGVGGGDLLATATPTSPILLATATPTAIIQLQPTATTIPTGPRQYTVRPGDWLYKIARENGVAPRDLIAANPQINPNAILIPGTVLTIPAPGTGGGTSGGKTYVVRSGDNLFRIGLNNGTTYQVLAQMNSIPAPYIVFPGQVLQLP